MEPGSGSGVRYSSLDELNRAILTCSRCSRLARFRTLVAGRHPRYRGERYWAKPLPGFGDPGARIVIVGLAPAAHGGNRTGRMFTGDESGRNLMRALHEVGLASKPDSVSRDDGLLLRGVYITAALRCPPPDNRPLAVERRNCLPFLVEELRLLRYARVFVALGGIAWASAVEALRVSIRAEIGRGVRFVHGGEHVVSSSRGLVGLLASYHPSPRNMRTGLLTHDMLVGVFRRAVELSSRL